MPTKMQKQYLGKKCDQCNYGYYIETHDTGEWNLVCNECDAIHFCYTPLPHQAFFHSDPAKYRMFAGGYG